MRSTQSGIPVCNFSIAVNRRFKNAQTGQQETDFFNIVAWRQLADLCGRFLAKGRKVAVVGSIQTRTYEGRDGSKRSAFDIVADEVEFLNSAQSGAGDSEAAYIRQERDAIQRETSASPAYAAAVNKPAPSGFIEVEDDELPF